MRNAFAAEITALAAQDERIVLLSGDIGNRLFDEFKERYPRRFLNCGVAEANMIGLAAGLALSGLRPVTYTIASFTTVRCLEQIRVDACYHHLPVVIAGVGAGLSYAANGCTHHSCEDIALLRVLPGMTVVCPGDACEVRLALRAALQEDGPVYLRLGKKGEPVVHQQPPEFIIGKGITVRAGTDVCLLSTGNMLPVTISAAEELAPYGISARVVSLHTVKPLDSDLLAALFAAFPLVVTVEEHSILGGLGGCVAEWLADRPPQPGRLIRIGTADHFLHEAGEQDHAREHYGLTPEKIAAKILGAWNTRFSQVGAAEAA
jgi:transketolase